MTPEEIEKKQWTEDQLKRRKKLSAATSVVGSGIGLTALTASAVASKPGRQAAKRLVRLAPAHRQAQLKTATKQARGTAKRVQTPLLTAGAGIGGVGGLNYAGIQSQEAKRRNKPKVVVVNNTTHKKLRPSDFSKAYRPFNAEERRHRRNKVEAGALAAGSGAALAGAGYQANRARQGYMAAAGFKTNKAKLKRIIPARKAASKAGGLLALGAVGTAGAVKLATHEKSRTGRTYSPQYRPPKR